MAITIQELLASDTISQVVDKINFNFDQLLLNGGGPVGPAGASGPTGPIGGRGERGTEWYEGTDDPNVTAPTPTPLKADYYLQSNGDVWEYTGLTWNNTGINLTGPTGSAGASAGWSFFGNDGSGNYFATAKNTSYPSLMPSGSQTINVNNEGVSTAAFGIAGPNDNGYPGIPLTTAFQLTSAMAGSLDSSTVTMLVHQKDSSASAIKFMGGGSIANDNYEQDTLANLSSIKLGVDDSLVIDVPKTISGTIGSVSDTYGFNVYTTNKAQNYRSGRSIQFTTGTLGNTLSGAFDVSDFSIEINPINASNLPTFNVEVLGSKNASLIAGDVTLPASTTKNGRIVLDAGTVGIITQFDITLKSGSNEWKLPGLQNTSVTAAGLVSVDASGKLGSLSSGGSMPTGILGWSGTTLTGDTGVDKRIVRWDGVRNIESSGWSIQDTGELTPVGTNKWVGSEAIPVDRIYMDGNSNIFVPANTSDYLNIRTNTSAGVGITGIQISKDFITLGGLLNSGALENRDYEYSAVAVQGKLVTGNRPGGRIELHDAFGTNSTISPGILGPISAGPIDARDNSNTIIIEGGEGFNAGFATPGIGHRGRDVNVRGGTATLNSSTYGDGGDVYISGGIGGTSSGADNGRVIIGVTAHNFNLNSVTPQINIGAAGTGVSIQRKGYLTVQQPSGSILSGDADNYIATFVKNSSTAGADGRIRLSDFSGSKNLYFATNVSASAYSSNAFYSQAGDSIITADGTTGGSITGLGLFVQNRKGGIRIDGENQKVMIMGDTAVGNDETAVVSNQYNSEVGIYMEGDIHITTTASDQVNTHNKDKYVILSGQYTGTSVVAGQGLGQCTMNWTRVGRIVNVSFYLTYNATGGDRVIPFPIRVGTTTPDRVWGSGTARPSGNNSTLKPVYIFSNGTGWKIYDAGNNGLDAALTTVYGTFSYRLV